MLIETESSDPMRCESEFLYDIVDEIITADLLVTNSFPSDDIWKKFEFCDLPQSEFTQSSNTAVLDDDELDAMLEWSLDENILKDPAFSEIRHHDCMWAGHCGSKEHKPEVLKKQPLNTIPPVLTTIVQKRPTTANPPTSGRSLLLNPRPVSSVQNRVQPTFAASGNVGPRPDSPPNSDEDDSPRFKHELSLFDQATENKTLQLLKDAISECDLDEDSDLCDYFEDSEVFAESQPKDTPRVVYQAESDHSYHKGKGAQLRTDHLGVQTPSDSEEEIDVVSVGEKQLVMNIRNCGTVLPTNPSVRDRQKLQRTVASAISCKREYNSQYQANNTGGIKTRLPLRLPATPPQSGSSTSSERSAPIKKKPENRRGVKRGRHRYPKSPANSPAKRRHGYSSDSETECSDKRNMHNNMERQRRVDLRNAFDDLRVLVPEVSVKERAAKVAILREAAGYCNQLQNDATSYTKQVSELRRQQDRLRARLSQLRKMLAAKR